MTKYEARFTEFSYHATFFIPTEAEKLRKFIKGLTYGSELLWLRVKYWDYFLLGCGDSWDDRTYS